MFDGWVDESLSKHEEHDEPVDESGEHDEGKHVIRAGNRNQCR